MLIVLADDVEAAWFYCIRTKIGSVVWCWGRGGLPTAGCGFESRRDQVNYC